jgi:hypothetical protein
LKFKHFYFFCLKDGLETEEDEENYPETFNLPPSTPKPPPYSAGPSRSPPKHPRHAIITQTSTFSSDLRLFDVVPWKDPVAETDHFSVILSIVTGFKPVVSVSESGRSFCTALHAPP